jgi:uncharacterized membrane protein YfcA
MPDLPFGYGVYAVAAVTVAVGYFIFAITGFGAALLTVPMLSHFLPLPFVLPLAVLLDVGASIVVGIRFHRDADWRELGWMVPFSFGGAVLGVTLLVNLPRGAGLFGLGVLLVVYGVYSLRQGVHFKRISGAWAPVSGGVGGLMGTLFGIGAPPYAIYLARRMEHKATLRATLSTMVLASTGMRLAVFAVAGLVLTDRLLAFALLFPFVLAGLWAGQRLHVALPRDRVLAAISALLIVSGASIVARVIGAALA